MTQPLREIFGAYGPTEIRLPDGSTWFIDYALDPDHPPPPPSPKPWTFRHFHLRK